MASVPSSSAPMSKVQRGRPKGSKSFDASTATAFGSAVRERRIAIGIAQEALALLAGIDRSFVGKVERGENQPSLVLILRLAKALGCSGADLLAGLEERMLRR